MRLDVTSTCIPVLIGFYDTSPAIGAGIDVFIGLKYAFYLREGSTPDLYYSLCQVTYRAIVL